MEEKFRAAAKSRMAAINSARVGAGSRSGRISSRAPVAGVNGTPSTSFGIVGEAVLRVGVRPGLVEHELAEGMRFDVGRRCRGQSAFIVQRDRRRLPPGARPNASGVLQRGEKSMAQER